MAWHRKLLVGEAMEPEPLFAAMNISTAGLTAQRKRLGVVAENLANLETTRTAQGGPYRRRTVSFEERRSFLSHMIEASRGSDQVARTHPKHQLLHPASLKEQELRGVGAQISEDQSPFREVYDPGHPDADEEGFVKYPNVDIVTEMTELISATRAFEANVTAFNAAKGMMRKALEL
jgi:flagellar basal-body rod protein FlgC